jgi:phosphohistidine phosphatase
MLRLYLMRHAKTERGEGKKDFDRLLTSRGKKDATSMALRLSAETPPPELILCSPAKRALETAEIVSREFHPSLQVEMVPELYHGTAEVYLEIVAAYPGLSHKKSVLIIAHNPSMEQLADHFDKTGKGMGTSEAAWFDFPEEQFAKLCPDSRPQDSKRFSRL